MFNCGYTIKFHTFLSLNWYRLYKLSNYKLSYDIIKYLFLIASPVKILNFSHQENYISVIIADRAFFLFVDNKKKHDLLEESKNPYFKLFS